MLRGSLAAAMLLTHSFTAGFAQTQPITYKQAIQLYNAGKFPEARDTIRALLLNQPEEFQAYKIYWNLLARTRNSDARLARVRQDLPFLEHVAVEKRTEDYYSAYEYALQLTGNSALEQSTHRELM